MRHRKYSTRIRDLRFTSLKFTGILESKNIRISMDGKGRALDNIMIERFWRTLKYELIYRNSYETVSELRDGIVKYIKFYNHERRHSSLNYTPPAKVFNNNKSFKIT